jgi:preprotein translocase subunit SecG
MVLTDYMMIATDIVAVSLIVVVLVQGQSASGLGSMFGGSDIYRTRRGIEKTLFNVTLVLTGLFLTLSLLTVALE